MRRKEKQKADYYNFPRLNYSQSVKHQYHDLFKKEKTFNSVYILIKRLCDAARFFFVPKNTF